MPGGRKLLYASEAERKAAARDREFKRDLPRKLEVARRRHYAAVREIKRAGLDGLLFKEEKDWS